MCVVRRLRDVVDMTAWRAGTHSTSLSPTNQPATTHVDDQSIGVASYAALRHVTPSPPRLPTIDFILLHFGAIQNMAVISCVKYLQDFHTTVIKISLFFILLKKWKGCIGYFCITVYIWALFCVILCALNVLSYFDVLLCPTLSQILATTTDP